MNEHRRATVLGLTLVHAAINSGGYLVVKVALREFEPFAFAFWRLLFGLTGLAGVLFIRQAWPRIEKRDWPKFLLLGLLAVPLNQLFYLNGMRYTVPSHASLLYSATAAVALVLAAMLGYEKLRRFKVAAIALAVGGVALVVSESPTPIIGTEGFGGDALIAISVVAWASYTVLSKPMVIKYGATRATLVCVTIGSVLSLPFLAAPAAMQDYSQVTWRGWAGALYTGIMITVVTYTIWFALLKRIEPSQVAILTTPQPVLTTALSVLLLKETVGLSFISGALMVIGGVLLMQGPTLWNRPREPQAVNRRECCETEGQDDCRAGGAGLPRSGSVVPGPSPARGRGDGEADRHRQRP